MMFCTPFLVLRAQVFLQDYSQFTKHFHCSCISVVADCRSAGGAGRSKGARKTTSVADREIIEEEVEAQASREQAHDVTAFFLVRCKLDLFPTQPRSALAYEFLRILERPAQFRQ